jgi:hypothetical protein
MIVKGYLGGVPIDLTADDPHVQYTKVDGTRAFVGVISGVSPTQEAHLATKGYVDTMAAGVGFEPVLSKYDPTGGLPGAPTTGDRYLSTATANGWVIDRLYEYNGDIWDEKTPGTGDTVLVLDEAAQYAYVGDGWVALITTDHGALGGLADDDHPQYLKLNKEGQTLTENLIVTALKTIDGRDVSVDGAKLDTLAPQVGFGTPAAKSIDTIYQAPTDGILVAHVEEPTKGYGCTIQILSNSATPPTTSRGIVLAEYTNYAYAKYASLTVPIIKSHYYKVVKSIFGYNNSGNEVFTIYFYPLGS